MDTESLLLVTRYVPNNNLIIVPLSNAHDRVVRRI